MIGVDQLQEDAATGMPITRNTKAFSAVGPMTYSSDAHLTHTTAVCLQLWTDHPCSKDWQLRHRVGGALLFCECAQF